MQLTSYMYDDDRLIELQGQLGLEYSLGSLVTVIFNFSRDFPSSTSNFFPEAKTYSHQSNYARSSFLVSLCVKSKRNHMAEYRQNEMAQSKY
jgi:hypothetical protein